MPSSLSRGLSARSVATSLPPRLANLSQPTAANPHPATTPPPCRPPSSCEKALLSGSGPAFSVGFYYLEKSRPPWAPQPPSLGFPLRKLALLPAGKPAGRHHDNGLAQSLDDARPDSPPSLTQICLFKFQLLLSGFVLLVSWRQLRC